MKPIDIFGKHYYKGMSGTNYILEKYKHQDCVIAHYTSPLASLFIIKSKFKHFALIHYKNIIGDGAYRTSRVSDYKMIEAIKILEQHGEIIDRKEFEELLKKEIIKKIWKRGDEVKDYIMLDLEELTTTEKAFNDNYAFEMYY